MGMNNYDIIEYKVNDYIKENNNDKNENKHAIHIIFKKGLYQNIGLELIKYFNNQEKNFFIQSRRKKDLFEICIVCKKEKTPFISIGCK